MNIELSVIIPAYNAGHCLADALARIVRYMDAKYPSYELIAVNDGSTDDTVNLLNLHAHSEPRLKVVNLKKNLGKGFAVRTGMIAASGEYALFVDADLSADIACLEAAMEKMASCDIVIASRNPKDAKGAGQAVPQGIHRRLAGIFGNLLLRTLGLTDIRDTQCGFKLFRRKAYEEIFGRSVINGWAFDIEVMAIAKSLGCRVGVTPVKWVNNPKSLVRSSAYFECLLDALKIKWRLLMGKYN